MSGLIAIVRGIRPEEATTVARAIFEGGFRAIEVPLNSPEPFASIRAIRAELPDECRVGAGTVLTVEDVDRAADAGSDIIVSPNTDARVIAATVSAGMESYPGVATVSEAFTALGAGARNLKLFPSTSVGIDGMKAWRSVLPAGTALLPVGGVEQENLAGWARAGADGAGIGSSLFRPGTSAAEAGRIAREFVRIWAEATASAANPAGGHETKDADR